MTASPLPPKPQRAASSLAAIGLTCALAVYVVAVPLVVRHGKVGWRLGALIAVAAVVAVVVLILLSLMRRTAASTRTAHDGEVARFSAHSQQQAEQLRRLADQVNAQDSKLSTQDAELTTQAAELTEQTKRLAEYRKREQELILECDELRESGRGLRTQLDTLEHAVRVALGERIPAAIDGRPVPSADNSGLDQELAKLLDEAVASAAQTGDQQASMRSAVVSLSRRVQAAAHRIQEEATLMADRHPGDPDVLEVSMRVDHAAAQQARNAQSMAVLCGEWPGQQWPEPLPLVDVVRAASGRIIAYRRIEVAGDPDIAVAAPAVEPMIHLVAELLANATQSSPPATQVPVTVRAVQRGAVVEVHDCGVGLDDYRLSRARDIASGATPVTLAELGEVPQTGLAVIGQYVRRHGFRVDVSESVYGGVRAVVGVPADLIETVEPAEAMVTPPRVAAPQAAQPQAAAPRAAAQPQAAAPAQTVADTLSGSTASGSTATPEAKTDTSRPGLPRRQSPRHAAPPATETAEPIRKADSADMEEPTSTSPEEAGAWMGAFLSNTAPDIPVQGGPAPDSDVPDSDVPDDAAAFGDTGLGDTAHDNSTEQQEQ